MPKVLVAVGDASLLYTESLIQGIPQRLADRGMDVQVWTTVDPPKDPLPFRIEKIEFPLKYVDIDARIQCVSDVIVETRDVFLPFSQLPLWKVLVMDDFVGSISLHGVFADRRLEADVAVLPSCGVDCDTREAGALFCWVYSLARRQGIPTVLLEVSPFGNKNDLSLFPCDFYLVKTDWAKDYLVRQGIATEEQVGVLRYEEAYLLQPGKDEYVEGFLRSEKQLREKLKIPYGSKEIVIFVPHHIAFLWETRHILRSLSYLKVPFVVVSRVDSRVVRRALKENEIFVKSYKEELKNLPHLILTDEGVGLGLLIQLADVVVSPLASVVTEKAYATGKPTIIFQAGRGKDRQGDNLVWVDKPQEIPSLIALWHKEGRLSRMTVADAVLRVMEARKGDGKWRGVFQASAC